ncbi:hypothetical protein H9L05_13210 [Hymenobacter qilianensis]|uniref:Uncharacterized protein n=1 Tax=Hymenobacter qilianensis TaxID=1385715 RepID=A0A7H0GS05_9BACT|nr:hypothetical protein [Hymenobacter qilianensis]QNP51071.1 hypothetical protein H9L05_13210 [Hymenobacter qilianensis]
MSAHNPTMPPRQATRAWLRILLTLLLLSVTISFLTCLKCLDNPRELTINFVLTAIYTTGLWLANGYSVDWLDRYVRWKQAPAKRLALTLLVSLGALWWLSCSCGWAISCTGGKIRPCWSRLNI